MTTYILDSYIWEESSEPRDGYLIMVIFPLAYYGLVVLVIGVAKLKTGCELDALGGALTTFLSRCCSWCNGIAVFVSSYSFQTLPDVLACSGDSAFGVLRTDQHKLEHSLDVDIM